MSSLRSRLGSGVLGPHRFGTGTVVRAFQPGARHVAVVDEGGETLVEGERVDEGGLFEAFFVGSVPPRYRLRIDDAHGTRVIDDPYRFGPILG